MSFSPQQLRRHTLIVSFALSAWALAGCAWVEKSFAPHEAATSAASAAVPGEKNELGILFPLETIRGGLTGNAFTGAADTRFRRPNAVAARDQILYIVDAGLALVFEYDRMSARLKVLTDLKGMIAGDAADIYVANDRSFYIADTLGGRVLHFSANGRLQRTIMDDQNLRRPVAISVDEANGDVYVADGGLDHILVFNSGGKLFRAVGSRGDDEGEFRDITGMVRDRNGNFLVTTRLGYRAQTMDNEGRFLYQFDKDTLVFPNAIAVDQDGRTFVSDFIDNSIKIFEEGHLVAVEGGSGVAPGRFKGITDLWVDGGFLYAADSLNGRIQVFRIAARTAKQAVHPSERPEAEKPKLEQPPPVEQPQGVESQELQGDISPPALSE